MDTYKLKKIYFDICTHFRQDLINTPTPFDFIFNDVELQFFWKLIY